MIEDTVLNYLNSQELSARAYTEIPKNRPSYFWTIEKTGSSLTNHINHSTIAIKSYAPSLFEAASMNDEVKAVMLDGLITLGSIAKVELNSDYNYTDTTSKNYRYQAVFDITHY